jgi:hypothetical protein
VDRANSSRLSVECGASPYRLLATVLNVLVRLVPTEVIIPIAATAINAAIRPYSRGNASLVLDEMP